ncbi:glutathione S-transferase family protein [Brucella sp. BE17]|uniref:glutathione S-transferase family protein n=1 Tax=Brucella sp. BE17 TaxID=3142977 RepID=UPI0031B9CA99
MEYELYWISGSPYSWRVMLTLGYKGIPYVSHRIDSSTKEHKSADYLLLNPRGQVPTFTANASPITESVAIMAFLEEAHPEPVLFGRSPIETARTWETIFEFENYIRDQLSDGIVRPLLRGLAHNDPDGMRASASSALDALGWMEKALQRDEYLAGDTVSAADIVALPNMQMLARVGRREEAIKMKLGLDDFAVSLPAISAWLARMETIPGYDSAYPPHWRG